ncbi:MAG: hypothetical protein EAX89_12405 [Candidatus Lokiarchaeota archaeon]|nr:hypothetical protein [Candidatus Lokiarchaeota archaeon]
MKLPKEIFDEEKFLELSKFAFHCRVKRLKNSVKLKLRTKKHLYTFKTNPTVADRLLKGVTCEIIEL